MSPRWNWDSPTPLAASEYALPPGPKGGGAPIPTTGETLSTLPTLCSQHSGCFPIPRAGYALATLQLPDAQLRSYTIRVWLLDLLGYSHKQAK